MLGGVLAVAPVVGAHDTRASEVACIALGLVALLMLTVTLTMATGALTAALLAFGAEYALRQLASGTATAATIAYASGLLLMAELATWSSSLRERPRLHGPIIAQHVVRLAGVSVGAALIATIALLASSIPVGSALAAATIGLAGGCALLLLVLALEQRRARQTTEQKRPLRLR